LEKERHWSKQVLRTEKWKIEHLSKHADLAEPPKVLKYIQTLNRKDTYKSSLACTYKRYCLYMNIYCGVLPKFSKTTQEVKVPTHERIEMIISASGKVLSLKLELSMKTGLGPAELTA
jgi:hypothetical protein